MGRGLARAAILARSLAATNAATFASCHHVRTVRARLRSTQSGLCCVESGNMSATATAIQVAGAMAPGNMRAPDRNTHQELRLLSEMFPNVSDANRRSALARAAGLDDAVAQRDDASQTTPAAHRPEKTSTAPQVPRVCSAAARFAVLWRQRRCSHLEKRVHGGGAKRNGQHA